MVHVEMPKTLKNGCSFGRAFNTLDGKQPLAMWRRAVKITEFSNEMYLPPGSIFWRTISFHSQTIYCRKLCNTKFAHTHSPAQISWQRWRFGPAQFATHKIMRLFLKFSTKWNWWTVGKYLMRSICPLVDFCHTPHTIQQRNTLSPTAVGDIVCYRA